MDNDINCVSFDSDLNNNAGNCCYIEDITDLPSEICKNCIHYKHTIETL